MLADFLKPDKWKLIVFSLFAILAFTLGYNPCGSACSMLDAFCADVCVVKYAFLFWPFSFLLGPNDILKFSLGSVFFILCNSAYWYVVSCFIAGTAGKKKAKDDSGDKKRIRIRFKW